MSDFPTALAASEAAAATATAAQADTASKYVRLPKGAGVVTLHLLPPKTGQPFTTCAHVHYLGQENTKPEICRNSYVGRFPSGSCPFCARAADAYKERKSLDPTSHRYGELTAVGGRYRSTDRHFFNAWVPELASEADTGVRVLSVGKQVRDMLIGGILGDASIGDKGFGDVTDVNKSRAFRYCKLIEGGFPKYHKSRYENETAPLPADKLGAILNARFDLSLETICSTEEEITAAYAKVLVPSSTAPAPAGNGQAISMSEFNELIRSV